MLKEGKPLDAVPTEDAPQTPVTVAELEAQLARVRQMERELQRALLAALRREGRS